MKVATRAVEAFGSALLPEELGGPAPELFSARAFRLLDALPPSTRAAVITGMLVTTLAGNGVARTSRRRAEPDRHAAALTRIQGIHPQVAAGIDGLKAIALLANEGDANRDEIAAPARAHGPARPDAEIPSTSVDECASVLRADVVVVGSGAGGATAARTLARAGMDVVIVEEGRRWTVDEFRSRSTDTRACTAMPGPPSRSAGRRSFCPSVARSAGVPWSTPGPAFPPRPESSNDGSTSSDSPTASPADSMLTSPRSTRCSGSPGRRHQPSAATATSSWRARPHSRNTMSQTSLRTIGTSAIAAALMGAGALMAPAVAQAQIIDPIEPADILKIDSSELTVDVRGDTAHFTVTAPDGMACVGPLLYEGSISDEDIDPATGDAAHLEELFSDPVWPTVQSDLHAVVNESSDLADAPNASTSPHNVSVPDLAEGDYVAATLCATEGSIGPVSTVNEISTLQDTQIPVEMHLRNFSVTGGGVLGSVDVFGSLGSVGS